MKLVIDEKLKHRLVGVAVILSLGAIFLPALFKKSSHRLENNFSVHVQLPPKPSAPKVVVTDEKELFKTIKVAKIKTSLSSEQKKSDKDNFIQSIKLVEDVANVRGAAEKQQPSVAKVEQKKPATNAVKPVELALNDVAKKVVTHQIRAAVNKPAKPSFVKIKAVKKPVVAKTNTNNQTLNKKGIYAVQLASFSKLANAQALVVKLQKKGYKANYVKLAARHGVIYKVYAGHSPVKSDVIRLKTQLASAMQLNGFVVNTGVS